MNKILKLTALAATLAAALLAGTLASLADPQQIPIPSFIANGTNGSTSAGGVIDFSGTNTAATAFTVPRDRDLGLLISQTATNNGNSNVVYGFNYQVGALWTTTKPLLLTNTMNNSNTVNSYFFVSKTNLIGVNALRLDYFLAAQTNTVTPGPIYVDWTH